jgi:hypothetical protein
MIRPAYDRSPRRTADETQCSCRFMELFHRILKTAVAGEASVKEGQVSEREALSKASNPQALEMNFKGIFLDEGRRILN